VDRFYFSLTGAHLDRWIWRKVTEDGATEHSHVTFVTFNQCLAHARRYGYISGARHVQPPDEIQMDPQPFNPGGSTGR
jgi:hypothetical protein